MIAFGQSLPIVGVGTFAAWLVQVQNSAPQSASRACVALPAERGEVFCQRFSRTQETTWRAIAPAEIQPLEQLLVALGTDELRLGPGLLEQQHAADWRWQLSPHAVAEAAGQLFRTTGGEDVASLAPNYMRKSAAEEKAAAQRLAAKSG